MKRILSLALAACLCVGLNAQNLKFGHINSRELVDLMPERDSTIIKLENYRKELTETLTEMQTEYQNKVSIYQQKAATWTAAVLESKQKEINEIQKRLEEFGQSAQQEYADITNALFAPVYQKAEQAIKKVATDNGFAFIFDLAANALIYYDTTVSQDILPLAKAELGIPPEKVAPTQLPEQTPAVK